MTEELMSTADNNMSENLDIYDTDLIAETANDLIADDVTLVDTILEIQEKKDHNFDATKFYLN